MDQVYVNYTENAKDLLSGHNALLKSISTPITRFGVGFFRLLFGVFLVLGIFFLVVPSIRGGVEKPPLIGIIFYILLGSPSIFGMAFLRACNKWRFERALAKRSEKENWVEWILTPEDVTVRNHVIRSCLKWEAFDRIAEHRDGLLLRLNPRQGIWLPACRLADPDEARTILYWAKSRARRLDTVSQIIVDGGDLTRTSLS